MKWKKHGLIFDPTKHDLPSGCTQFAQSPQVLVFPEFVRIYFSTRSVDPLNGKFLSHIAYVDIEKDLRTLIRVADHVVLPLGGLGCFDEHGIFPMNVLRHEGAVYGYTCGWSRRVSVSVETAIGLAISRDEGLTFQRVGDGPIMAASPLEPCLVGDAFVKVINGVFHMWHIFGTGWKQSLAGVPPDRIYKIGHAVSTNGVEWMREDGRKLVSDRLGPDECQALPTVVVVDGRYHMFFCYRQAFDFRRSVGRGYRIGHAWSEDLINWTRDDEPGLETRPGEWDSDMQCYPHVFQLDSKVFMLYNGNEFGRLGFGLAELQP
ncbi:MAG: hypothetical protein HY014_09695 [Acidobacteria bacterium]|nr:hypothetical protein [Acidobacteriota bacterium]MBI3488426.1 hypothetical protein [Acidobacteriota bacterium]